MLSSALRRLAIICALSLVGVLALTACGHSVQVTQSGSSTSYWSQVETEQEKAKTASVHLGYLHRESNAYAFATPDGFYQQLERELDGRDFHTLEITTGTATFSDDEILRFWDFLTGYSDQITTLHLDELDLTPVTLQALTQFQNLTALSFRARPETELASAPVLPAVTTLTLFCYAETTTDMLASRFPSLETLSVIFPNGQYNATKILAPVLPDLTSLTSLSVLSGSSYKPITFTTDSITPLEVAIASMSKLQQLNGEPVQEAAFYPAALRVAQALASAQQAIADLLDVVAKPPVTQPPVIKGKILIAWVAEREDFIMSIGDYLSNLNSSQVTNPTGGVLPDSVFATGVEDCETLIYITRVTDKKPAFTYTDGAKGLRASYFVNVIDVKNGTHYAPVRAAITSPPTVKQWPGDARAPIPYSDIYTFIAGLIT